MEYVLALAAVAEVTMIAAPAAEARNWDGIENRFDRADIAMRIGGVEAMID